MNNLFDDLTPVATDRQIADKLAELQDWLAVTNPDLDVQDPIVISTLLAPWVSRLVDMENRVSTLERLGRLSYNGLADLDPDIQDSVRDRIAQLLGLTVSNPGTAIGDLRIIVDATDTLIIPAGTRFRYGSVEFYNPDPHVVRAVPDPSGNSLAFDRHSTEHWSVEFAVMALLPGTLGNLASGSQLTTDIPSASIVRVETATNFVGGSDASSLDDLLRQVHSDTFSKSVGTRDQLVSLIGSGYVLGGIRQLGVVGLGDVEHLRSQHPFLPVRSAGAADLYLASSYYPIRQTTQLTGTVVQHPVNAQTQNLLRIVIPSNRLTALYRVLSVQDVETGGHYRIVEDQRGFETEPKPGIQLPTGLDARQASFTAFQTVTLYCSAETPLSLGQPRAVRVSAVRLAGIELLQDRLSSRNVRSLAGDLLVKAACPVFLSVKISLQSQYETQVPDIEKIQAAVVDAIQHRPMRAEIRTADIMGAVVRYLPDDITIREVFFDGELVLPGGKQERIHGTDVIQCPHRPEELVTARTTAFYCSIADVSVTFSRLMTSGTP